LLSGVLIAAVAVAGFVACGGGATDRVVARVGQVGISESAVKHWMSVMAGGGQKTRDPLKRGHSALREQALSFLISSEWLIGEATRQGVAPSKREIDGWLERKKASFPGGNAEYREFLGSIGQTDEDVLLEAKAELASANIRQLVTSRAPKVTPAEIAEYYRRNRNQFAVPERRELESTNRKNVTEIDKIKREVETGGIFTNGISRWSVERTNTGTPDNSKEGRERRAFDRAIFTAKPNVIVGPVRRGPDYFLLMIKQITPGSMQPLRQAQNAIKQQLTAERQRQALAQFIKEWRQRWTARTDCKPGYVIQKCRQYKASETTTPEDPYTLD
jgi:parvulin-like peptidyl-prolyl isomerase